MANDLIPSRVDAKKIYVLLEKGQILLLEDLEIKQEMKVKFTPKVFDVSIGDEQLVVGDSNGKIHIMNSSAQETDLLSIYGADITAISLSPNNNFLLAGNTNSKVKLWNFKTKEVKI